jgi:hypothetical protein
MLTIAITLQRSGTPVSLLVGDSRETFRYPELNMYWQGSWACGCMPRGLALSEGVFLQ